MLKSSTKSGPHWIVNCSRSAATIISGWSLFEISLAHLLKIEEERNDHTGGQGITGIYVSSPKDGSVQHEPQVLSILLPIHLPVLSHL